jgi:hypothetical protein
MLSSKAAAAYRMWDLHADSSPFASAFKVVCTTVRDGSDVRRPGAEGVNDVAAANDFSPLEPLAHTGLAVPWAVRSSRVAQTRPDVLRLDDQNRRACERLVERRQLERRGRRKSDQTIAQSGFERSQGAVEMGGDNHCRPACVSSGNLVADTAPLGSIVDPHLGRRLYRAQPLSEPIDNHAQLSRSLNQDRH